MPYHQNTPGLSFRAALPIRLQKVTPRRVSCDRCQGTGIVQPPRDYSLPPMFVLSQKDEFCECAAGVDQRQREERLDDQMALDIPQARRVILQAGLILMPRHERLLLETLEQHIGKESFQKVLAFLRDWDGQRNLIVYGAPSLGKTGTVVSVMRTLQARAVAESWKMHFTTTHALFELLRNGFEDGSYQATCDRVKKVYLLALDDIGAEHSTPWTRSMFFQILAERYDRLLPTFITTNLSLENLKMHFSEAPGKIDHHGIRIMERLLHNGVALGLTGKSQRIGGA